ncbi:T9SS type A sorting domain-containing protein [Marinifilum sp.]|uniref:T9SS type A sorting domain-containing protein n=1 Tax=Marinifilum sp. TaxID=2033137 RepID=UPI003BAB20EB
MKSLVASLKVRDSEKFDSYFANLGADVRELQRIHGITYKLSFDSEAIYADSVFISADRNLLGLANDEYFEMQRVDSSFVLYSLTLKGRNKALKLDTLPILLNFVIKPETHYNLIANNCEYTIEFQAESVTAYDNNKTEIELSPFVLPIKLECEEKGESQLLIAAPNPTRERCWVHLPTEKKQDVKTLVLYNTAGKPQSFTSQLNDEELELNLDCLLSGHYYLNIIYSKYDKDVVKIVKL